MVRAIIANILHIASISSLQKIRAVIVLDWMLDFLAGSDYMLVLCKFLSDFVAAVEFDFEFVYLLPEDCSKC